MNYEDVIIPTWCSYVGANLSGIGCWSLIYGYIDSKEYCKDCECFTSVKIDNEKDVVNNQITLRAYLDLLKGKND